MLKSCSFGAELISVPGAAGPDPGATCACAIAVIGEEALSRASPPEAVSSLPAK